METRTSPTLNNEQTAALFTEIAAMIDAGTSPASRLGLLEDRQLGKIARVSRRIQQSLQRGQSLADSLAPEVTSRGDSFAKLLRGTLNGQSPGRSLMALANYLQRRSEYQRHLITSMVYPVFVVLVGYAALIVSLGEITGQRGIDLLASEVWSPTSRAVAQWLVTFWYVPPLIGAGFVVACLCFSKCRDGIGRAARFTRWGNLALFCDLLAIQLEQGVDLPEAVKLSAGCVGDRGLRQAAAILEKQKQLASPHITLPGMPPLMNWLLVSAETGEQAARSLENLASSYRQRQYQRWVWWTRVVPLATLVGLGGSMALGYGLLVLRPIYQLMFTWAE